MNLDARLARLEKIHTRRMQRESTPMVLPGTPEFHRVFAELLRPGRRGRPSWAGDPDLACLSDKELMRRMDEERAREREAAERGAAQE